MSEMSQSICEICGKEFAKKAGLTKHKQRKIPCKAPKSIIVQPVIVQAEFRETSKHFNASLTKEERSEQGIYFTPKKARDVLFSGLADLGVRPRVIL